MPLRPGNLQQPAIHPAPPPLLSKRIEVEVEEIMTQVPERIVEVIVLEAEAQSGLAIVILHGRVENQHGTPFVLLVLLTPPIASRPVVRCSSQV